MRLPSSEQPRSTNIKHLDTDTKTIVDAMEDSPLWKLPVELRLHIYELVLHTTTIFVCQDRRPSRVYAFIEESHEVRHPAGEDFLHLLTLCKQINNEAGSLFFSCNKFEVIGGTTDSGLGYGPESILSTLHAFVAKIGPTNAKALTDVSFFVASIDAGSLIAKDNKPILFEILRRLQVVQIQRPYWILKVTMECCLFPNDVGADDEEDSVRLYEPVIDLKQAQPSLMHVIADLEEMREKIHRLLQRAGNGNGSACTTVNW
ncbi:hypothetical protein LTR17_001114 [Elasticomyces elasticus]|nr:hypothetical protein LTR17_001114 [Elasticomyces elasticus]